MLTGPARRPARVIDDPGRSEKGLFARLARSLWAALDNYPPSVVKSEIGIPESQPFLEVLIIKWN